jgi:hypothetical protein
MKQLLLSQPLPLLLGQNQIKFGWRLPQKRPL